MSSVGTESASAGFSLVEDGWIPVLTLQRQARLVGLRELLTDAHTIWRITADSAAQQVALMRLVLALAHRILDGPRDTAQWEQVRAAPCLDAEAVHAYLDAHATRFLLGGPTPFMQTPGLRTTRGNGPSSDGLEKLLPDADPDRLFTTRVGVSDLDPAEAARELVALHAYDVGGIKTGLADDPETKGGKGYPRGSGGAARTLQVHLHGETLWESLTLNLTPLGEDASLPFWEQPPLTPGDRGQEPGGRLELLTWHSRRVLLAHDGARVTGALIGQGDRLDAYQPSEQHTIYRPNPNRAARAGEPLVPRKPPPGRTAWQMLPELLPDASQDGTRPPKVLAQRPAAPADPRTVDLSLTWADQGSKGSVWVDMSSDTLTIPGAALTRADVRETLVRAAEATQQASTALATLAANLVLAAGGHDQAQGARDKAHADATHALDEPTRTWIATLAPAGDLDQELHDWHTQAHSIITALGDELAEQAGPAAWRGRVICGRRITTPEALGWFYKDLAKALPRTRHK